MMSSPTRAPASRIAVYVTPISRLVGLNLLTLGLYSLYWFYRHWRAQKQAYGLDISPVARSVLSILYVHQLFRAIDREARDSGLKPSWDPNARATTYVLLLIVSRLVARWGPDELAGTVVTVAFEIAALVPLSAAQQVANLIGHHAEQGEHEDDEDEEDDEDDEDDEDEEDEEDEAQ